MGSVNMLLLAAFLVPPVEPAPSPVQIQKAVQRSLPFIQKGGVAWMKKQQCVSCHQVPFMLWSHQQAKEQNIQINNEKLTEWTTWSLDFCVNSQNQKTKKKDGGGLDTMSQLILALPYSELTVKHQESLRTLAKLIVELQQPEGYWKAEGQLPSQRRPKSETDAVTTMWTVLALHKIDKKMGGAGKSQEKALAWLKENSRTGKSNEWLVTTLLLAHALEKPDQQQKILADLLKKQNPDGGWSWLIGEKSDAFATGQSLFALGMVGVRSDHPAVQKAWHYLVQTQQDDGSWSVPSTKQAVKNHAATSTYWGTCWAVMGLCRTLPEVQGKNAKTILGPPKKGA